MLRFKEWFFALPIWEECDNYIYFLLAGYFLNSLQFEQTAKATLAGALIGALIMKGRGSVKKLDNK